VICVSEKQKYFFAKGWTGGKEGGFGDLPVRQTSLALFQWPMMTRAAIGRLRVPHTQLVIPGHREAMSYDVQLHIRES